MQRFRVGHGFEFFIDRSPTGGIWLDGGEWAALRERQFHDEIHLVFTLPWQKKARSEKQEQQFDDLLQERIGADAFQKALDFRSWLQEQPDARSLLAFISKGMR